MLTDSRELAQTYRNIPDEEIAALHAQADQLTEQARIALGAEIERRGLSAQQLEKAHSSELHGEANFDRREKWRRNSLVSYLLFRNDPRFTILMVIVFLLAVLISELVRNHH
jgi:hypothetical protein